MIELENIADVVGSPFREVATGELGELGAGNHQRARSGRVDAGKQVQQRGFSRAGWSHQCEEFALRHIEVEGFERRHDGAALVIDFRNATALDHRQIHGCLSVGLTR